MTDAKMADERLILHGSFTSSSTYKPMLFLALRGLPFSFRTVNLKNGVQKLPEHLAINRYGQVPVLRHRGLTLVMSNVILDYLVDKSLEGRQWLVGDSCTIADIGCFGRMVFMAEGGMSLDNRPNARAWWDRLMAMPGFALPYDLIPKKDAELPLPA